MKSPDPQFTFFYNASSILSFGRIFVFCPLIHEMEFIAETHKGVNRWQLGAIPDIYP